VASELDHLFICTSIGAASADRLIQFGLTEGPSNVHPGQGTANRRFFFNNAFLELLWVHNSAEAQSETTRPTHLWKRWAGRDTTACPFGLCFRSTGGDSDPLFSTWDYRPQYLPPSLSIGIGTNAEAVEEPFICHLTFAQRPDSYPALKRPPLEHAAGLRKITRVEIATPSGTRYSPELQAVIDAGLIEMRVGAAHLLEIVFDGELRQQRADFRPGLPLIFRW
jgi:hypothetical protein